MGDLRYDRACLVEVLLDHQQWESRLGYMVGCSCGWRQHRNTDSGSVSYLNVGWAEHVADVYELAAAHPETTP